MAAENANGRLILAFAPADARRGPVHHRVKENDARRGRISQMHDFRHASTRVHVIGWRPAIERPRPTRNARFMATRK